MPSADWPFTSEVSMGTNSNWSAVGRVSRAALVLLAALLGVCCGAPCLAREEVPGTGDFVPLEEVTRGDLCKGRTVFEGTRVEEFDIEIVDVVYGVGPGTDLIIGRAKGPILEKTGILQGMSGSPVYRDGRLVGAISGTWSYAKEPLAAITPIGQMLPALEMIGGRDPEPDTGDGRSRALGLELVPRDERASSTMASLLNSLGDPYAPGVSTRDPEQGGFVPISIPLSVSGADDDYLADISRLLGTATMSAVAGGSSDDGEEGAHASLEPGSAVGVQFVRGDASWTATGTVTYVDGTSVLAFGHPLFGAGSIEMPMVSAYVHALMPLQSVSFKYASAGQLLGTMVEDRNSMVAGVIGTPPRMIPMTLSVRDGEDAADFEMEVVRSRTYASYFAGLAVGGAVSSAAKSSGPATVSLTARVSTGDREIVYSDMFHSVSPAQRCAGEVSMLTSLLHDNRFSETEIERLDLDVELLDENSWISIDRVEPARRVCAPGDEVRLRITLRPRWGEPDIRELALRVPEETPDGRVLVRVADAASYNAAEADRLGAGRAPRNLDQLVELVETAKPGNILVAQLLSESPGFSLLGNEVSGAPGRAGLAMVAGAGSGGADPTDLTVLDERELSVPKQVFGFHELAVEVRSDRRQR